MRWPILFGGVPFLLALSVFLACFCLVQGVLRFLADTEGRRQRHLQKRLQELGGLGAAEAPDSLLKLADPSWLAHNLKKIRRIAELQTLLEQAGVSWHLGTFLTVCLGSAGLGLTLGFIKLGFLGGLVGAGLGLLLPYQVFRFKKKRRVKKFEKQLPEALDLLARGMRAGHAFASGLQLVAQEMDDPIGMEFFITAKEHSHGLDLNAALVHLCQRVDLRDLRFFTTAVIVQRETGGNLTEILEKIAALIRERFKLRNQILALTAEGRLSGWILVMLPPLVALSLFYMNPSYEMLLVTHPLGKMMALVALGAQAVGMLAIRKIVNIKV
jgi:tight adherence protein B